MILKGQGKRNYHNKKFLNEIDSIQNYKGKSNIPRVLKDWVEKKIAKYVTDQAIIYKTENLAKTVTRQLTKGK